MDRAEHIAWCKERALAFVEAGDLGQAVASMAVELAKHPETDTEALPVLTIVGAVQTLRGPAAVRRWIEAFA